MPRRRRKSLLSTAFTLVLIVSIDLVTLWSLRGPVNDAEARASYGLCRGDDQCMISDVRFYTKDGYCPKGLHAFLH